MIGAGMDGYPCRLVEHHQMFVFVTKTQTAFHRENGGGRVRWQRNGKQLAFGGNNPGGDGYAVQKTVVAQKFALLGGEAQRFQNFSNLLSTKGIGYGIL